MTMNRPNALCLSAITLLLASASQLTAQSTTGALSGRVTDTSGKPLPGVRIALDSPALFQPRVLTTNAKGEYRGQLLPVGTYTMKLSAEGYVGKSANDIRVGLGSNLNYDFSLRGVKQAEAVVEVTDSIVRESKAEDKTSYNYSADDLLKLPIGRSFDGALSIAPGILSDGGMAVSMRGGNYGNDNQRMGGGMATSALGGGYNQVLYHIDGIDVKDDTGAQGDAKAQSTLYQPLPDSIEDVQVVLSALNARNGRTSGGQVNIVTKTGGNEFQGSIRADMSRPSWTTGIPKGYLSPYSGRDLSSSEANQTEGFSRFIDVTVSGPIWKDRVWFYLGTRIQPQQTGTSTIYGNWAKDEVSYATGQPAVDLTMFPMITGNFPATDAALVGGYAGYVPLSNGAGTVNMGTGPQGNYGGGALAGYGPFNLRTMSDWGQVVPANNSYRKLEGKITGLVNADNTLFFTFLTDKTTNGGRSGERSYGEQTIFKQFMGNLVDKTGAYTIGWNGVFKNWFIEARLATARFQEADVVGPTTYPYAVKSQLSTGSFDQNYLLSPWAWYNWTFQPFQVMRSSASDVPAKRGNDSANINVKTFQDWHGQHEIDFGAENFTSIHGFGRERPGNAVFYTGGFIYNPTTQGFLFPTFYTSRPESQIAGLYAGDVPQFGPGSQVGTFGGNALDMAPDEYPRMGPGAHVVRYWTKGTEAKNKSQALWVNDIWSINANWNLMLGLRFNKFAIYDTDGSTEASLHILEPRLHLKWNPDGHEQHLFKFTAAKLASSFSDDMASAFRTNALSVYTLHGWAGLPGQLPIDSGAADPTGGVAWVNYGQLTNFANYGPAIQIADSRVTYKTSGLQVPYALEFTLGYTRNYDTGYVRINLVQRNYKKDWVSLIHDYGDPYVSLVKDPSGSNSSLDYYSQNSYFLNSAFDRVFRSVELAWLEAITSRLTFGGNFTIDSMTGINNFDYYNYRSQKLLLGLPESVWAPQGTLARDRVLNAYLTYAQPVGKGNVSLSVLMKYVSTGLQNLYGTSALLGSDGQPLSPYGTYNGRPATYIDSSLSATTLNSSAVWSNYLNAPGDFRYGADTYNVSLRLQSQMPLARKIMLTCYIQVDNLFNRILPTGQSINNWTDGRSTTHANPYIPGRPLADFYAPWGTTGSYDYYTSGRTVSTLSVGLKF
jgi:hypothetical protein